MQEINTKLLKSALSIDEHKLICKSLDIPEYSENSSQIVYYTGDKTKRLRRFAKTILLQTNQNLFRLHGIKGLWYNRIGASTACFVKQALFFWDSVQYILQVTGRDTTEIQRVSKPNMCDWQSGLEKYVRIRNGESILKTFDDGFLNDFPDFLPKEWLNEVFLLKPQ